MSDSPLALRNGNQVSSADEIYPRNRAGQYGKKLGVVGDLVPVLNCYRLVVEKRDEERIIGAIKLMLEDDRLLDLKFQYQAIVDSFQTYVDHEQDDTLTRTQHLCTESAPQFKGAFEGALTAFQPYNQRYFPSASVKTSLDPLITAADTYLIVLSIGFHSRTKLTPSSARNDKVVLPQIEAAIKLLEDRLQNTLLRFGTAKESPIAALLFCGDLNRFLYYYQYCKGYEGEAGVVRMVQEANEKKSSKYFEGYSVSSDIVSGIEPYLIFADALIALVARFKALRSIRLDFDPNTDSQVDPRAILTHSGSDTLALTVEGLTT